MLLKTGLFIDGTGGPPQYGCCIAVEAGKIAAVGRQAEFAQEAVAQALDYSCCTVLPGLIDSHVHLFLEGIADSQERQARWLENKEITLLRAAANLTSTLNKGVTTIRDLGGPAGIAALLKQAVKQKVVLGPRVLTCNRAISITGGHFHYAGGREADGPAELAQAVREQATAGADCIKLMATGMVDFRTEQTGRIELSEEDLKAAVQEARHFSLPVSVHVNGDDGVRQVLAAGVNTLEHGMLISEAVVDQLSVSSVHWLPTLTPVFRMLAYSRQHTVAALPEDGLERVYTRHCAMVRRGIAAGADLIAGTDAGSLGVEHGEVRQELVLFTALGMPPAAAIEAATGKAAKAIGLEATGVLKAGKDADLLVIRGNPLADMKALWNIVQVYKGGVACLR